MQHIFSVVSQYGSPNHITQGIPLPRGLFSANTGLEVVDEKGEAVPCHTKVLGLWPDRSIRWLLVDCILPEKNNLSAGSENHYYLQKASYTALRIKQKWVTETPEAITIELPTGNLVLSKSEFLSISSNAFLKDLSSDWSLISAQYASGQQPLDFELKSITTNNEVRYCQQQRPLFCHLTQTAHYVSASGLSLNAQAHIRIYYDSSEIELELKMHNPQAIVHNGGKWDLGNENSLYFESLAINCQFDDASEKNFWVFEDANEAENADIQAATKFSTLEIVQHSSGGEHFKCNNHKAADNQVHICKRGASVRLDEQKKASMLRPSPVIEYANSDYKCSLVPLRFWQRFPSAIVADSLGAKIQYAHDKGRSEQSASQVLELQPGEILSQRLHIHLRPLDSEQTRFVSPQLTASPQLTISPSLINQSHALALFDTSMADDALQRFIDQGINGPSNFFEKREQLDEYGWRNFGDIYADHEADKTKPSEPFVSHYNNQYDPLHGFLKQWLLSGDSRWRILADDLFQHLVNIDIYHTTLDKPEYNNGLFWHTDHYLEAQTATHRTYSKHQQADVYMDHAGGGGPGAHHCYTSGLALYYCLSGKQEAFECLSGMINWMQHIYEGDQTLLGLFLRFKNANTLRLPFTDKPLLGNGTGVVRDPISNRYPLDRGTGNYVNALLDGFDIQQDLQLLSEAERVIMCTIDQSDDISTRGFEDIENTWFYVVLLQGVAKYLFMAKELNAPRAHYSKILQAFLHYARYIQEQEKPYLTYAEKLEYPNDTWTAQDLRKVHVLACAALLCDDEPRDDKQSVDKLSGSQQKFKFTAKAKELQDWIDAKLAQSNESAYTRILALIMQNYGALKLLEAAPVSSAAKTESKAANKTTTPSEKGSVSASTPSRVFNFIKHYSISRERRHLVMRIPKLQKWLGKP